MPRLIAIDNQARAGRRWPGSTHSTKHIVVLLLHLFSSPSSPSLVSSSSPSRHRLALLVPITVGFLVDPHRHCHHPQASSSPISLVVVTTTAKVSLFLFFGTFPGVAVVGLCPDYSSLSLQVDLPFSNATKVAGHVQRSAPSGPGATSSTLLRTSKERASLDQDRDSLLVTPEKLG